jgi:hypothetical protein
VLAGQFSQPVVMAKCHWLKWRNRWVAKWLGGYCMAENSFSPKYTKAILPLHRLTTTNHHYHHYSHMTILAITTSRLAEWTFSPQTSNTVTSIVEIVKIKFMLKSHLNDIKKSHKSHIKITLKLH